MIAAEIEHYYPGRRFVDMTPFQVFAARARIGDIIGGGDGLDQQMAKLNRRDEGRYG